MQQQHTWSASPGATGDGRSPNPARATPSRAFGERQDAMDYAMALAGRAGNAGSAGGAGDGSPRARWPRRRPPDAIFRS
jgi:hypothetical protein